MTGSRKFLGLLATTTCIVAMAIPAQAQVRSYDIPAGDLQAALDGYARQSSRQLIYKVDEVKGKRTKGARGNLSADAALKKILTGTGFQARTDTTGAIAIAKMGNGGDGSSEVRAASTDSVSSSGRGSPGSGEAQAGGAAADSASADASGAGYSEILVVGSRSQNVDIRRTEDDAQPYVVFNREEIEQSQASNVEGFIRQRLPMNTQRFANSQTTSPDASNVSSINLRGLGANQTLILVDGRRAPRTLFNGDFLQGDLNSIPLSSIERIEVLPTTAGGIYGGGAVGGVINIIRRRAYDSLVARVGYDGAFRGGGETFRAELIGGMSFGGGKTQLSFSASHSRSRALYAGQNDLWRGARERYVANDPSQNAFFGYTPNIRSANGQPLVLDSGVTLGSNHTFVPVGYSGPASDGGTALIANAGRYSTALSSDAQGERFALLNGPRVDAAGLNIRQTIIPGVDVFADLAWSRNEARRDSLPIFNAIALPASAPNNPFQQDIQVYFPAVGADAPVSLNRSTSLSGNTGIIAQISRNWAANLEYAFSEIENRVSYTSLFITPAARTAISNGSINVVRDLNAFPIDYDTITGSSPDSFQNSRITQRIASARVSGTLFDLPGGSVATTMLLEQRTERVGDIRTSVANPSLGTATPTITPRRSQRVRSAYGEIRVPVVSERNSFPLLREFDLQASVRYDAYATVAASPTSYPEASPPSALTFNEAETNATSFTIAGRWSPFRGVTFRTSYATGFLPPSITQLVGQTFASPSVFLPDPRRGNTFSLTPFTLITGGSASLEPEKSRSFSLGGILEPAGLLPGLRLSIDYLRIRKSGEIITVPFNIQDVEAAFPERVSRSPNLPGDPAGWAGPVRVLDVSLINGATTRVTSLDFQADYRRSFSDRNSIHAYLMMSHQLELRRQLSPIAPEFDSVGYADGPLDWRGNLGLDWSLGRWTLAWNMQYYAGYRVRTAQNPSSFSNNNSVIIQGNERISDQTYQDLSIRYEIPQSAPGLMAGTQIILGVQNLFDTRPPVIGTPGPAASYSFYGDPRLRRFSFSLRRVIR